MLTNVMYMSTMSNNDDDEELMHQSCANCGEDNDVGEATGMPCSARRSVSPQMHKTFNNYVLYF